MGQKLGPYAGVGGRGLSFSVGKESLIRGDETSGAEPPGTGDFLEHLAPLNQLVPLGNFLNSLSLSFSLMSRIPT